MTAKNETVRIGCIGVGGRGYGLLRSLLQIKGVAVKKKLNTEFKP